MSSILTFDGRNPTQYNVDDFTEDMALYWHVKNVAPQRRTAIFNAAICNPTKRALKLNEMQTTLQFDLQLLLMMPTRL